MVNAKGESFVQHASSEALDAALVKMGMARALVDLLGERFNGHDANGVECLDLLGLVLDDIDRKMVAAAEALDVPAAVVAVAAAKPTVANRVARRKVRR